MRTKMIIKNLKIQRIETDIQKKDNLSMSFVASTPTADRYNDIISIDAWNLSSYKSNPIILFNHDPTALPIGKGDVEIIDGKLLIDIHFDKKDPVAAEIGRKCKEGYLNAVSVGFSPLESIERSALPDDHEYKSNEGNYYTSVELLEVSVVTIPANSEAVAAKKYRNNRSIAKHILEILEEEGRYLIAIKKEQKEEEVVEEEVVEENSNEIIVKKSEFFNLPVTDEPFNPRKQDRAEIENAILSDGDWERYKKAHLWYNPENTETKEGYKFIVGRIRDPNDPENAIPEKGRLYVYRDQLGAAIAAINGSRSKPNINDEERKSAYQVAEKYYEKLGLEAPPFKEELSYDQPKEEDDSEETKAFFALLSAINSTDKNKEK